MRKSWCTAALLNLLAAMFMLSGCAGNAPEAPPSEENQETEEFLIVEGTPVADYTWNNDVDITGEDIYIIDKAKVLSNDEKEILYRYNANWHEEFGFHYYVVIEAQTGPDGESIIDVADSFREEKGIGENDALLVIDNGTGSFSLTYGTRCPARNLTSSLVWNLKTPLFESIHDLFKKINDTIVTGTPLGADISDYDKIGAKVAAGFQEYMEARSFIVIDVSDMNAEVFPDSKVLQAGDGHINVYCMSGSLEDSEFSWHNDYDMLIESATPESFVQKWTPGDLEAPCSVSGIIDGAYFQSELIGGTYISFNTNDPELKRDIEAILVGLGVPQNNSILK